jgi:hypothetical protein
MNNYRPISVLPSLSKLFEKIVYAQIYEYLTVADIFKILGLIPSKPLDL